MVILSVLIGAGLHILWDSFTHGTGYFVCRLPALRDSIQIFGTDVPVYRVLQHFSTALGGVALAIYIMVQQKRTTRPGISPVYWLSAAVIGAAFSAVYISVLPVINIWNVVIAVISALLAALVLSPLVLRLYRGPHR